MSMAPSDIFTVILDKSMSNDDCNSAYELIAETKGVLASRFNEQAKQIKVKLDRKSEQEACNDIRNIGGVLGVRRDHHL